MTNSDDEPLSDFGQESELTDTEADLIRSESLGEMVERAVLLGVALRMTAYIGVDLVTITVTSEEIEAESRSLH